MWIKTVFGVLVNTDFCESIVYDEEDNRTKAVYRDGWQMIAEGDVTPLITSAIIKDMPFVGVR